MPTRNIKIGTLGASEYTGNAAGVKVDSSTNELQFNPAGTVLTVVSLTQTQTLTNKTLTSPVLGGAGLNGSSQTFTNHPINLESATLAANTNVIRGASINPTRTSGWISFSGTISTSPANCYTDYRELHTTGTAQVLGAGFFPYMDSGASCQSMFAVQAIAFVSSGSTVTTASGAQGTGVYAIYAKTTIDSATVDSGAQLAAAWLSVQANVTDVSGRASAIIHMEVASGAVRDIFTVIGTGNALSTNLFYFSDAVSPLTTGGSGTPTAASGTWYNLRCSIDGTAAYIPISTAAWTNA